MTEFISLHCADKYMKLPSSQKRHKLMKLERVDGILKKAFKFCIILSIFYCTSWNIDEIKNGSVVYGVIDMFIEYIIYPLVLALLSYYIRQGRFGLFYVLGVFLIIMMCHTPSYSLMLVWSVVFAVVRFKLSGMQRLAGYPDFHDDLRGRHNDVALTEDQRYAAFQSEVKSSNKYRWGQQDKPRDSTEILSGKTDLDGYFGVQKCENPGVMDELVIPDDLDLEDGECYKK